MFVVVVAAVVVAMVELQNDVPFKNAHWLHARRRHVGFSLARKLLFCAHWQNAVMLPLGVWT